jgi:probable rRNA maturation factor
MLAHLQLKESSLSIVLTNDKSIQQLNRIYRRKNRPTDVLAFPMREGEFSSMAGALLGDVVISVPTARRQALGCRRSTLNEVTMLLAHGLLHLVGWDHDTASKDRAMRAETERLIAAAGPTRRRRGPKKGQLRAQRPQSLARKPR